MMAVSLETPDALALMRTLSFAWDHGLLPAPISLPETEKRMWMWLSWNSWWKIIPETAPTYHKLAEMTARFLSDCLHKGILSPREFFQSFKPEEAYRAFRKNPKLDAYIFLQGKTTFGAQPIEPNHAAFQAEQLQAFIYAFGLRPAFDAIIVPLSLRRGWNTP